MSKYIDFAELKTKISIIEVAELVGLDAKKEGDKYRAPCPVCASDDVRAIVITPSKEVFYCHAAGKGGDLIALAAHIEETGMRDAAMYIHSSLTVPETVVASPEQVKGDLKPLSHLEHNHDLVSAIGFDTEQAEQLGIGYAKKGLMRGTVAVPLRTTEGVLVGYIGITDGRLPKNLKTPNNVIYPFPKKETA